jgi:hypothetical protein
MTDAKLQAANRLADDLVAAINRNMPTSAHVAMAALLETIHQTLLPPCPAAVRDDMLDHCIMALSRLRQGEPGGSIRPTAQNGHEEPKPPTDPTDKAAARELTERVLDTMMHWSAGRRGIGDDRDVLVGVEALINVLASFVRLSRDDVMVEEILAHAMTRLSAMTGVKVDIHMPDAAELERRRIRD